MSLFGSLMGDLDDDPIFGSHMRSMRHMNTMMNSLFSDPFGMMGQNAITDGNHSARMHQDELQMMPFRFPPMPAFNMGRMFPDFGLQGNMAAPNGNFHSFTSRSVMTMASGANGQPQVYQETMSTTTAPGGVKETKQTVSDSRTGLKKMAIGHHIGDRAHIMEREHNMRSGEREEREEFINLDEEEADSFNSEWETRTRRAIGAGSSHYGARAGHSRSRPDHRQLALPDPSASRHSSSSKGTPTTRRSIKSQPTSKLHSSTHVPSTESSGVPKAEDEKPAAEVVPATASSSTSATGNRKRKHTPDCKSRKKQLNAVSDSNV